MQHNVNACIGTPSTPQQPEETEPLAEKDMGNNMGGLIIILVVGPLAGGGAFYYLKIMKAKQNVKGSTDIEDFDFDEYDEDNEHFEKSDYKE